MKTRLCYLSSPGLAVALALTLTQGSTSWGQSLGTASGSGRTVNERLATETPPPINTDPSRPELRSVPGAPGSQGFDKAILIEHAVDMAIEGSTLLAVAGPAGPNTGDLDPVKHLRNKARKMLGESQTLLGQAASDVPGLAANPLVSRFHSAANLYVTTLAGIEMTSLADVSQLVMVNQAVKEVLDADHILQMSRLNATSVSLQQLKTHAAQMKLQGNELIRRLSNQGSADSSIPVNVSTLAVRGQQLLEVADQLGRSAAINSAQVQPGMNSPGRFQNNNAQIIGGTYSNGSPRVGVYQGLDHPLGATNPKAESEPSTIPTYSGQTTGSTGGVRPQ